MDINNQIMYIARSSGKSFKTYIKIDCYVPGLFRLIFGTYNQQKDSIMYMTHIKTVQGQVRVFLFIYRPL